MTKKRARLGPRPFAACRPASVASKRSNHGARSESFLIDPGYYQGKADNHSLPLVDGKGPSNRGKALITDAREKA